MSQKYCYIKTIKTLHSDSVELRHKMVLMMQKSRHIRSMNRRKPVTQQTKEVQYMLNLCKLTELLQDFRL